MEMWTARNVPTRHASWPTVLGLANLDHRLTLATHRPTPFKDVYTELSFASYVARESNVSPYIGLIHSIQYETRQEQTYTCSCRVSEMIAEPSLLIILGFILEIPDLTKAGAKLMPAPAMFQK